MSMKTADDVYVKDEPCSDLQNEYEPASALAANTWQDVKVEWDSETCGESDVAPTSCLYTECDEDDRESLVGLVKSEEQSESACLSEDEGQYIKEEVKEELELGPTAFLQPRVTLVCQESSQDNGTKELDTESVSGVHGHQETRDEENPYKCGYCTYTTRYKINYTRHERQHIHDNKSMCEGTLHTEHATEKTQAKKRKCTKVSSDERASNTPHKDNLIRHKKIHTKGKSFKCTHCSYTSAEKRYLKRHERIHIEDKPFKCTHCSYSCVRKSSLKIHEGIHVKDKPFKCTHCSYSCVRNTSLKLHERIHTQDKPFKCTHCSYSCVRKNGLKLHETIHTGDKPYKCAYCTYSCALKTNLNRHQRTHTGDKPYKCAYCAYSCAQKIDLNCHERIHTGEKPFKCNDCSYSCIAKTTLNRHMLLIHTEDKPYKCAYCSYSCALKPYLNRHERIHTDEKPYKCAYCIYSCVRKLDLSRHERTHTNL